MEKMLVTKALDERDFLRKKILTDIENFKPITVKREMDPKCSNGQTEEEFIDSVRSQYQSIRDNIDRHHRICRAITISNAITFITVNGVQMSKAEAIELKKKMSANNTRGDRPFEAILISILSRSHREAMDKLQNLIAVQDNKKDAYINSLLAGCGDKNKKLSEEDITAVEKLTANYTPKVIDPIDIKKEFNLLDSNLSKTLEDIETAIKISNATTEIEF